MKNDDYVNINENGYLPEIPHTLVNHHFIDEINETELCSLLNWNSRVTD